MKALSGFSQFLLTKASGRNVLVLLAISIVSFGLMAAVITPAFQEVTNGLRPFDLNFGVSAETMYRELPHYSERSRTLYLWFAFADFVYPAAASAFFALLWGWMFMRAPRPVFERLVAAGILALPFLFAAVDWLENFGFLWVIFRYPAEHHMIGDAAGTLKQIKPFVEAVILLLTIVFAVTTVWLRRGRNT